MDVKHGVTGVIFDEREGKRYFLVLHRVLNWRGWEFVKGGIDAGENPEQAVFREIDEESGLTKVKMVCALPEKVSWIKNDRKYVYTPFILRGDMTEPVNLVQEVIEHDAFRWVAEKEVENILTHEDNRRILRETIAILDRQKN